MVNSESIVCAIRPLFSDPITNDIDEKSHLFHQKIFSSKMHLSIITYTHYYLSDRPKMEVKLYQISMIMAALVMITKAH